MQSPVVIQGYVWPSTPLMWNSLLISFQVPNPNKIAFFNPAFAEWNEATNDRGSRELPHDARRAAHTKSSGEASHADDNGKGSDRTLILHGARL